MKKYKRKARKAVDLQYYLKFSTFLMHTLMSVDFISKLSWLWNILLKLGSSLWLL